MTATLPTAPFRMGAPVSTSAPRSAKTSICASDVQGLVCAIRAIKEDMGPRLADFARGEAASRPHLAGEGDLALRNASRESCDKLLW